MENNVSYEESLAEFNHGAPLKYRILKLTRHLRTRDDDGNIVWVDKVQYVGQRIVPSGWFSRKWETITFKDELGQVTYFDNARDIIDWFKYLDGDKVEVVKLYSTHAN